MALRDLLCDSEGVATATVATTATPERQKARTVARVASVALAKVRDSKTSAPDSRLIADPSGACSTCGGWQWRQPREGGAWQCRECEADAMPLTATTLTIGPWHPSEPQ